MDNQFEEKKEIPGPPPSKVSVRTMQSDIKSIQGSGGQNPQPYMAELGQVPKRENPAPAEVSFQPTEMDSGISGYAGPEEPIFQPGAPISPLPPKQKPAKAEAGANLPKKKSKVLPISIIIVLAAITTGAGYYFINKNQTYIPAPEPTTTPVETATPTPTPVVAPQYVSLLKTPSIIQGEEVVPSLALADIKNSLLATAGTAPLDSLKEVVLRNQDQSLVALSQFLPVIFPELTAETISQNFQENFTALVFTNVNGVWPGYVAQLNPTADLIQTQAAIKQSLESSANLANIFLGNVSPAVAVFKDGKAGNPEINTRYLVFPETGAAINYGWIENKLVISSSYAGLSEILKKLQ